MANRDIAITGIGIVSSLGKSGNAIALKLLRGDSGVQKFSSTPGVPQYLAASVRSAVKTVTPERWPITRATALAMQATQSIFHQNGTSLSPDPRLGLIHATAYGNLQSLLNYQADLRKFGLRRASPMQFPNTILHAAASFLSISIGATAFNITLSNENTSGLDALETASDLVDLGAADRVLVVTSENVSTDLIPMLESYDELDIKKPDPFGEKRGGYVPGEAAVAILVESVQQAQRDSKKIYAVLRGSSGLLHGPHSVDSCERALRSALASANIPASSVGCIFASANGSRSDGEEANAIAQVFGSQVLVTSVMAAFGECGASSSLLSIAAAIYCGDRGYYPPTAGRSHYDRRLEAINLLRRKTKVPGPVFIVNGFNRSVKCSQAWCLTPQAASA